MVKITNNISIKFEGEMFSLGHIKFDERVLSKITRKISCPTMTKFLLISFLELSRCSLLKKRSTTYSSTFRLRVIYLIFFPFPQISATLPVECPTRTTSLYNKIFLNKENMRHNYISHYPHIPLSKRF